MKTTAKKSTEKTVKRDPRTPPKPKADADAEPAPPNPASSEMDGGRKGAVDGRFEADHRPSR